VIALIVLAVAICLVVAVVSGFRWGSYCLSALLAAVAVARAILPVTVVGPLAVRSRVVDVVTAGSLAAALAVLPGGVPV
jgi:hypothetical protein